MIKITYTKNIGDVSDTLEIESNIADKNFFKAINYLNIPKRQEEKIKQSKSNFESALKTGDIDVEEFHKRFGHGDIQTSLGDEIILKINERIKTVTVLNEDNVEVTKKVENFWVKVDGKTVIEW